MKQQHASLRTTFSCSIPPPLLLLFPSRIPKKETGMVDRVHRTTQTPCLRPSFPPFSPSRMDDRGQYSNSQTSYIKTHLLGVDELRSLKHRPKALGTGDLPPVGPQVEVRRLECARARSCGLAGKSRYPYKVRVPRCNRGSWDKETPKNTIV